MSDKYVEVFNLEAIKEKLVDWQTEETESTVVDFWPLDIRRVEWLIKQAERLHGTNHRSGYIDMYADCNRMEASQHHEIKVLQSQNKRYREALKEINDSTVAFKDDKDHSYHAERVARKALEGEGE